MTLVKAPSDLVHMLNKRLLLLVHVDSFCFLVVFLPPLFDFFIDLPIDLPFDFDASKALNFALILYLQNSIPKS